MTTLYRTALSSDKKSYASGYAQSLHEILDVIMLRLQQNASTSAAHSAPHARQRSHADATQDELIWLARYIRARLEAIKAESEDDEEERESEEEEDEVQAGNHTEATRETPSIASRGQTEEVMSRAEDEVIEEAELKDDAQIYSSQTVVAVEPPTISSFTFSHPSTSNARLNSPLTSRTPQGQSKRRIKGMPGASPATAHVLSAPSVSEEDDGSTMSTLPQTPSKQRTTSSRLGKRSSRDKATAMDLFSKSVNAKRRRGMGDRRDDERRDGGLH